MVLEKTLESPLDCKEIQPVHSEGDQLWDFKHVCTWWPPSHKNQKKAEWGPEVERKPTEDSDGRVPAELGQESQASSCLRKGTPLASRVAQGDFIFLGSKITADGDCSHEIKRRLLLGRKVMKLKLQNFGHLMRRVV